MVKLRLKRRGRKARPVYDIVAADGRSPRDGRFIERVGQYNPLINEAPVTQLNRDRVIHWLSVGAQPTDTVRSLLKSEGILLEMYMSRKGAPMEEVVSAVERHTANRRNRRAAGRKATKPAAEAEAPAAEAPVAEPVAEPAAE